MNSLSSFRVRNTSENKTTTVRTCPAGSTVRVLIVEEQACVRQCIKLVLQASHRDWEWIECGLGMEAIRLCKKHKPDAMILDLGLPDICGVEAMRRLNAEDVRVNTLVHSGLLCKETLVAALRCGPLGFVEKNAELTELREGVRRVVAGESYFTPMALQLMQTATASSDWLYFKLSAREIEVVRLLSLGHSSKSAASALGISVRTVDNHRSHIMEKLKCHDITALVRYAVRKNIISANEG